MEDDPEKLSKSEKKGSTDDRPINIESVDNSDVVNSDEDNRDEDPRGQTQKLRSNTVDLIRSFAQELRFSSLIPKQDDTGEADFKSNVIQKEKRLTRNMASIFIVGTALGGFLFELCFALKKTGWLGVFLIIVCGVNSLYSGMLLGWCWIIMEERWPEYRTHNRSPYAEIGYKVGGKWLKYFVTVSICLNQMGFCIPLLRLMSKFIDQATSGYLKFCYMLIIHILLLLPFTFHGTPKNFKYLGVVAFGTSCLLVVLFSIAVVIDKSRVKVVTYEDHDFHSFTLAFGSLILCFNAGAIHPTIQVDMYDRKLFPQSVFTAYLVILLMFVVFPVLGFATYGDEVTYDVLDNISRNQSLSILVCIIRVIFVFQIGASIIIQMNPMFQSIEDLLKVPTSFTYKRCLVRSSFMFVLLLSSMGAYYFVGIILYTLPVTVNLLTYLFPTVFYIVLVYQKEQNRKQRRITKKEWIFIVQVLILGIIGIIGFYLLGHHQLIIMKQFDRTCFTLDDFLYSNFSDTGCFHE